MTSGAAAVIGGRLLNRFGRALVVVRIATVIVGVSITVLATQLAPASIVEWYMGAGLLLGGAGGGLVISPNQTLTLSEIPVTEGSAAGSMTQLGQRLGTAVGVSAVTAVFFGVVLASGHTVASYQATFRDGFFVTIGLLVVSPAIGIIDLRQRASAEAGPRSQREASAGEAAQTGDRNEAGRHPSQQGALSRRAARTPRQRRRQSP